jgi:K+/H+ antiporter YhaU regulatory subunit KhtT
MVEPARQDESRIQRILPGMAERRMAEVVRKAQSLSQVFVEAESARNCATNLGDFDAVRQPDAIVIAVRRDEDLRLMSEAAERYRMDDPVPVSLERIARPTRAGAVFWMEAAARPLRVGRQR